MKQVRKTKASIGRRAFLGGVAIGAGAAGVAAVVSAAASEPAGAGKSAPPPTGYRETDHVLRFYESASF
ncbi:MAG: hypothetical protein H3C38_04030 [Rhodospirillales bacterium]|nr:hypothetical protein [Rhodospirillales bacterium]